jgi:hypothetical protein
LLGNVLNSVRQSRWWSRLSLARQWARMRLAELCNPGGLRTFWCIDRVNFGDLLTPALLRHYGFNPVWATAHRAKVIAVGSLLQAVPETYDGYILGTGLIYSSCAPRFDRATVFGYPRETDASTNWLATRRCAGGSRVVSGQAIIKATRKRMDTGHRSALHRKSRSTRTANQKTVPRPRSSD